MTDDTVTNIDDIRRRMKNRAQDQAAAQDDTFDSITPLRDDGCRIPDGYQLPHGYAINLNGVYTVKEKEDAEGNKSIIRTMIASSACLVSAIMRDEDGKADIELAWRDYGTWRYKAVPKEEVRSGRTLRSRIGGFGFPVMDSSAKAMEQYLDKIEAVNRETIPTTHIARTLGWQKDGTFVARDGEPYPVHPHQTGLDHLLSAYHPHGNLQDWREQVAEPIRHYPIPQMAVYASLAAPLLRVLNVNSFVFSLAGTSSKGKSTSLRCGLSAWANPADDAGMLNWSGTQFAQEVYLTLMRGVPLAFDETSKLTRKDVIRDVLYTLPQGRTSGKGQQTGLRTQHIFSTIVLSSGEKSIFEFSTAQGTAARALEIQGAPFGLYGGDDAILAGTGASDCYGTAGPEFTTRLRELLAQEDGREQLRQRHETATGLFRVGSTINKRRAPMLGVVYLAAQLAVEWGIMPYAPPAVDTWVELFHSDDAADNRPLEAFRIIHGWVSNNPQRLFNEDRKKYDGAGMSAPADIDDVTPETSMGWVGRITSDGGFALLHTFVRELLDKAGYDLDSVKGGWDDQKLIKRGKDNLLTQQRMPGTKARPRAYFHFTPPAETDVDDADDG